MNLSDELFGQITASLAADAVNAAPADNDQRETPRLSAGAGRRATLIPLTDSLAAAPIGVTLRDLSPGGVGFLHTGRVALNEEFVLMLPTHEGSLSILCGVAYWQPVATGVFAVGAKFNRVLRQGLSSTRPAPIDAPIRKAV